MTVKGISYVMVQFRLQAVEGSLGLIVITLKLGRLHQFGKLLLADWIVGESALHHPLLERLPVCVSNMELRCGSNSRMLGDVIHHVVEHHLRRVLS